MLEYKRLAKKERKIKKKINKKVKKYLKFLTSGDGYDGAMHIANGLFIALSEGTYDVFNFETHLKGFNSFEDAYHFVSIYIAKQSYNGEKEDDYDE